MFLINKRQLTDKSELVIAVIIRILLRPATYSPASGSHRVGSRLDFCRGRRTPGGRRRAGRMLCRAGHGPCPPGQSGRRRCRHDRLSTCLAVGADVIVKLDGDGQMDPALIPQFVAPILEGTADYVKGNRFYNIEDARVMPMARVIGDAVLLHKTKPRYSLESGLLSRPDTMQACLFDPPPAIYAGQKSSMNLKRIFIPFLLGNAGNTCRRVFYSYSPRGFLVASLELLAGIAFLVFGIVFGSHGWAESHAPGRTASAGTVMLAALPILLGIQLLLSFLAFDSAAVPSKAHTPVLPRRRGTVAPLTAIRSARRCGA